MPVRKKPTKEKSPAPKAIERMDKAEDGSLAAQALIAATTTSPALSQSERKKNDAIFGNNRPPRKLLFLENANLTAIELLVFFPEWLRSFDLLDRLWTHGGKTPIVEKVITSHRTLAEKDHLFNNSMRKLVQATMRESKVYPNWTTTNHHKGTYVTRNDWSNPDDLTMNGKRIHCQDYPNAKLGGTPVEDVLLKSLGDDVKFLPDTYAGDGLDLVRVVIFALGNPGLPLMLRRDYQFVLDFLGGPRPVEPKHRDTDCLQRWSLASPQYARYGPVRVAQLKSIEEARCLPIEKERVLEYLVKVTRQPRALRLLVPAPMPLLVPAPMPAPMPAPTQPNVLTPVSTGGHHVASVQVHQGGLNNGHVTNPSAISHWMYEGDAGPDDLNTLGPFAQDSHSVTAHLGDSAPMPGRDSILQVGVNNQVSSQMRMPSSGGIVHQEAPVEFPEQPYHSLQNHQASQNFRDNQLPTDWSGAIFNEGLRAEAEYPFPSSGGPSTAVLTTPLETSHSPYDHKSIYSTGSEDNSLIGVSSPTFAPTELLLPSETYIPVLDGQIGPLLDEYPTYLDQASPVLANTQYSTE